MLETKLSVRKNNIWRDIFHINPFTCIISKTNLISRLVFDEVNGFGLDFVKEVQGTLRSSIPNMGAVLQGRKNLGLVNC